MKPKALYMFVDPSVDPTKHRAEIETPKSKTVIQGVRSIEEGASMAKQFVEEGVSLVELCGGFGYAGAKAVSDAVGDRASVGMIVHQVWNAPKLAIVLEAYA